MYWKRRLFTFVLIAFLLSCVGQGSGDNTFLQIIPGLELPGDFQEIQVIVRDYFTLGYHEPHEQASWAAYKLSDDMLQGETERLSSFRKDPEVLFESASSSDYSSSGYDRGHLVPAADMVVNEQAMYDSFYMSNVSPQLPGFNRGIWKKLENQIREWVLVEEELYIVAGPVIVRNEYATIGENEVALPDYFFKAVLDYAEDGVKAIGFLFPHEELDGSLEEYTLSIDSLEEFLGFDLFPKLPDDIEERVEFSYGMWDF
jgi:endonuclease G